MRQLWCYSRTDRTVHNNCRRFVVEGVAAAAADAQDSQ